MVKKIGQRKFLIKYGGYTGEQLDKMTPSEAHKLISDIERNIHPQGQTKRIITEKEKELLKEFGAWYSGKLNKILKHEEELYESATKYNHTESATFYLGEKSMLQRLLHWFDKDIENFLKEQKNE